MNDHELIDAAGRALWGPDWKPSAAGELGVGLRVVQRWAAGQNPIPPGVWRELSAKLAAHSVKASMLASECASKGASSWRTEFPDYPADAMPAIPADFIDQSWHNDTCPSFHNAARMLTLWVDYPDRERREFPENEGRFQLVATDQNGDTMESILCTDDWPFMLNCIARHT